MSISAKGLIFATVAATSWGAVYALNEQTLNRTSPIKLMILCGLVDLLILPFLVYWKGGGVQGVLDVDRTTLLLVIGTVLLGFVANYCILSSIQDLGASVAAVVEITYPIFTIIILSLFFSNRIDLRFGLGAFVVMIGIGIIVTAPGHDSEDAKQSMVLLEDAPNQDAAIPGFISDLPEYDVAA